MNVPVCRVGLKLIENQTMASRHGDSFHSSTSSAAQSECVKACHDAYRGVSEQGFPHVGAPRPCAFDSKSSPSCMFLPLRIWTLDHGLQQIPLGRAQGTRERLGEVP